jgi:hypothetical protein
MTDGFVKLQPMHELILAVVESCGISRLDHLTAAAQLAHHTRSGYSDLLAKIVAAGIYPPPSPSRFPPPTQSRRALPPKPGAREISEAARALQSFGLLKLTRERDERGDAYTQLNLTDEGRRAAETVTLGRRYIHRPRIEDRNTVFIACAFARDEITELCDKVFIPACEEVGLNPCRIDRAEPSGTITDRMLDEIRQCRLLIADLTFARQSVYFEVGVAHGLGIPIVLTCREDHKGKKAEALKVHFDLVQFKISYWGKKDEGFRWEDSKQQPRNRLRAALQEPVSTWTSVFGNGRADEAPAAAANGSHRRRGG